MATMIDTSCRNCGRKIGPTTLSRGLCRGCRCPASLDLSCCYCADSGEVCCQCGLQYQKVAVVRNLSALGVKLDEIHIEANGHVEEEVDRDEDGDNEEDPDDEHDGALVF